MERGWRTCQHWLSEGANWSVIMGIFHDVCAKLQGCSLMQYWCLASFFYCRLKCYHYFQYVSYGFCTSLHICTCTWPLWKIQQLFPLTAFFIANLLINILAVNSDVKRDVKFICHTIGHIFLLQNILASHSSVFHAYTPHRHRLCPQWSNENSF